VYLRKRKKISKKRRFCFFKKNRDIQDEEGEDRAPGWGKGLTRAEHGNVC